LEPVTSFTCK